MTGEGVEDAFTTLYMEVKKLFKFAEGSQGTQSVTTSKFLDNLSKDDVSNRSTSEKLRNPELFSSVTSCPQSIKLQDGNKGCKC